VIRSTDGTHRWHPRLGFEESWVEESWFVKTP